MAMKQGTLPTVVEVEGVHGFVDDKGVAWLDVEDVARGLGFVHVEEKVSPTSGRKTYESIRWERINGYLAEFDYPPVKAGDFIPENIFYLLAMKASNEAAKTFQLKIANEILPSIRKTGSYSIGGKTDPLSELVAIEREKLAASRDNFAKAQLLRELASASGENYRLRKKLIRASAALIMGKEFFANEPTIEDIQ